jgi:hypothetical protein
MIYAEIGHAWFCEDIKVYEIICLAFDIKVTVGKIQRRSCSYVLGKNDLKMGKIDECGSKLMEIGQNR